jgi:hypothetical protein
MPSKVRNWPEAQLSVASADMSSWLRRLLRLSDSGTVARRDSDCSRTRPGRMIEEGSWGSNVAGI